jgi:methionyl-tRNA synthetase
MKKNNFYITTTLPYVNAPLHLGHATEIIRADAVARYKLLAGYDVFFNTGTDEHGQKIFESAEKAGKDPKEYVDYYAKLYKITLEKFGVLPEAHYIRTTDEHHVNAAQAFWKICFDNGYIYKKNYQAKYCIGCEEEKTESELVDGKCPEHNRAPEIINEENYFFRFSAFQAELAQMYEDNPDFIVPSYRMNEMKEFIKRGLHDFSISRLKSKMSWGIPVPNDEEHVMYVWFDALTNYISTLGWPHTDGDFKRYWIEGTPTQYCGKNNTRFQGLMWQAMLLSVELPPTRQIVVDGFILGEGGVKMSKTLGNTIDPVDIIDTYGTEMLRYIVLREFHPFEDTAVSKDKLKEIYNANLANGLGNLVSRIMKMAITYDVEYELFSEESMYAKFELLYGKDMANFNIKNVMDGIWESISMLDRKIADEKPFAYFKEDPTRTKLTVATLVVFLNELAFFLKPFMPETSEHILTLIKEKKMPEKPLFVRKD